MTPIVTKIDGSKSFSKFKHVLKFHKLLMDGLDVTIEIH